MKYDAWVEDYVKCPDCGKYNEPEAGLCKKCGHDFLKEVKLGTKGTKDSKTAPRYR